MCAAAYMKYGIMKRLLYEHHEKQEHNCSDFSNTPFHSIIAKHMFVW